jgi:sodium/potassium-transporting ATPase subunit alpha
MGESKLEHVDIHEHQLSFDELQEKLGTSLDIKDPSQSAGITTIEAASRLARDGRNILTPPKKKSALRKASLCSIRLRNTMLKPTQVFRLLVDDVQHFIDLCRYS